MPSSQAIVIPGTCVPRTEFNLRQSNVIANLFSTILVRAIRPWTRKKET